MCVCVAIYFFLYNNKNNVNLPDSIGDPLELVMISDKNTFNKDFYRVLKSYLSVDIGPSPQSEKLLSIIEVDSEKFTGLFKRHQNLLFVSKSDSFRIVFNQNVFARDQSVTILEVPYIEMLETKKSSLLNLVKTIKHIEKTRLVKKFKLNVDQNIADQLAKTHKKTLFLPKGFFVAHQDSNTTWLRRETPKISQGIFISNLTLNSEFGLNPINNTVLGINSKIAPHISGSIEGSYMVCDLNAPISIDTIMLGVDSVLKIQSLWRMEQDFMGGAYLTYLFYNEDEPTFIYTYLYAPGETKKIPLLQLESMVSTLELTTIK